MILSFILIQYVFSAPLNWKEYYSFPESLQKIMAIPATPPAKVPKITVNKLELLDEKRAEKIFKNKAVFFQNLHGINMSPYTGFISREVVCPNPKSKATSKTIKNDQLKLVAYEFFTNDYLTIGVCEEKEMKYGGRLVQVYCKKTRAFLELTAFDEIDAKRLSEVTDIHCRK